MDTPTTSKAKVNVKLREKALSDGSRSLYLDFYPPIPNPKKPGQYTRREFLGIYLLPTDTPKEHAQKWARAKEIEITRQRAHGTNPRKQERALHEMRSKTTLSGFMRLHAETATELKASTRAAWHYAASMFDHYLKDRGIEPEATTFDQLDTGLIHDFRRYLLTEAKDRRVLKALGTASTLREERAPKLAKTTAAGYFNTVLLALKTAYKGTGGSKLLSIPMHDEFQRIEAQAKRRQYLTMDEARRLATTPCKDDLLRRASLFSILTGLRFSDIANLTWADLVVGTSGHVVIRKTIKKTDKDESLPITDEAASLLLPRGERGKGGKVGGKSASGVGSDFTTTVVKLAKSDPDARVFAPLKYNTALNPKLQAWVAQAGIDKDITFHSLRHTFAVLHIDAGTDLFTLSKLMTHSTSDVTGRVYADVLDEKKRNAAQRIKLGLK
jgi:integrase